MPMDRATLELFAPLDRARRPLRAQLEDAICAAITGGGAPAGHPAARLARARRDPRRLARRGQRGLRADRRRGLDRGPPRRRPRRPRRARRGVGPRRPVGADADRLLHGGGRQRRICPRARVDLTATAPDLARVSAAGVGGGAAEGAGRDAGRGARLRRPARGRGAAARSWRRIWCGCAARWRRRSDLVVTQRLHAGAVADVPGAGGARRAADRGRGPVAGRLWATIRSAGLEVVGWPVDEHGLVRADRPGRGRGAVTPAHQFPTGAVLAPERRRALLAWGGIVIEDDYDSEYRYDRAPVGTLQRLAPDRVVYLGTASKTLAPALRLGLAARPAGSRRGGRRRALAGRLRRPGRSPRAPTPACWPPATSTATCGAPAASTATGATRSSSARGRLPDCRVEGVAAGLHLVLRLPTARTSGRGRRPGGAPVRIRGLPAIGSRRARTSPRWSSATAAWPSRPSVRRRSTRLAAAIA